MEFIFLTQICIVIGTYVIYNIGCHGNLWYRTHGCDGSDDGGVGGVGGDDDDGDDGDDGDNDDNMVLMMVVGYVLSTCYYSEWGKTSN